MLNYNNCRQATLIWFTAEFLKELDKTAEAKEILHIALTLLPETCPLSLKETEVYFKVHYSIGQLCVTMGKTQDAEKHFRKALHSIDYASKYIRKNLPDMVRCLAHLLFKLANLVMQGGSTDITDILQKARRITKKTCDPCTEANLKILEGFRKIHLSKLLEAENYFKQALDIRQKWYGKLHPVVAEILEPLADLLCYPKYSKSLDWSQSKKFYKEVLKIQEDSMQRARSSETRDQINLHRAITLYKLGKLLKNDGNCQARKETAERLRHSFDLLTELLGPNHHLTMEVRRLLKHVEKQVCLSDIEIYGFDYDYTLAFYSSNLHTLIFNAAREILIQQHKYPEDLRKYDYNPNFVIRGLHYDVQKGIVMKIDAFHYIQLGTTYSAVLGRLIDSGKKLFLITNSPFSFVDKGMQYMVGKDWRDLFDIIIVQAEKPAFFNDNRRPFRRANQRDKLHWDKISKLEKGKIYKQGNLYEFLKLTGWTGSKVLYFGDHIYSDLADLTLKHGWRTGAIIPELRSEIKTMNTDQYNRVVVWLQGLTGLLERMQTYEDAESRMVLQEWIKERNELREMTKTIFNPQFGSIFRTHHNPTYFSRRLSRFADIYMASLSCILSYNLHNTFYPRRTPLQHEASLWSDQIGASPSKYPYIEGLAQIK
ncbi:hypothetical protein chiPu_0010772 [Chiloscyllium punctatum]|uniref:5'-nucleotidase domain-containing protein 3 n=1 Tax=Chiloscyllium punctatum TaxID=137246 RepID=A0A401SPJ4_CHIPU|nr:hypothetical protein [Chiloscyllium punctatum]